MTDSIRYGFLSNIMMILATSAAFVGLVHSLAPGHWLPVVLMAKTRRWSMKTALMGAVIAASGHILLSVFLGLISFWVEVHYFAHYEEDIERYAGLALGVFGILFALQAYLRHSSCHGHTHHGPDPQRKKAPFAFLFMLGLTPCAAVLPVFGAAAVKGSLATLVTFVSFSVGVLASLIGSTVLFSLGLVKLDHPILEHYADVITGLGVAIMGFLLFFLGHSH